MKNREEYKNIEEYLKAKDRLKRAMHNIAGETAEELGYDQVEISGDAKDMTSRTIGLHTGPVGGVVVQKLITMAEKQLMEKYGKK